MHFFRLNLYNIYKMKLKKIRGHKRIWKAVKLWEQENIDLDIQELKAHQRKYVKIWVSPYCDYDLKGSQTPEPKGETRALILEALINIYHSWQRELEHLEEPYYLKIWLYEPNFSRSQIVCALGNFINFYETAFNIPKVQKKFNPINYGRFSEKLKDFKWTYAPEEKALTIADIGEPEEFESIEDYRENKKYVRTRLKRPFRKSTSEDETSGVTEYFWFKHGAIWLGEN